MIADLASRYTPEYCAELLRADPKACSRFYQKIVKGVRVEHRDNIRRAILDGGFSRPPTILPSGKDHVCPKGHRYYGPANKKCRECQKEAANSVEQKAG